MLAKFINEYSIQKQRKGEILKVDGKQVINPRDDDYLRAGYKKVIESDKPEIEDGYFLQTKYVVVNDKIVAVYSAQKVVNLQE